MRHLSQRVQQLGHFLNFFLATVFAQDAGDFLLDGGADDKDDKTYFKIGLP